MKLFRLSLAASVVIAANASKHVRSRFLNVEDEVKADAKFLEELEEDSEFWGRSLQLSMSMPTDAPVPPPTDAPVVPATPAPTETPGQTVWDVISAQPERFSNFIAVSVLSGRDAFYRAEGDKTVFVPTDDAFGSVQPSDLLSKYLDTDVWTTGFLSTILSFHDIPGTVLSEDLVNGTILNPTGTGGLLPSSLLLTLPPPILSSDSLPVPANIVEVDLTADNGVVHVVDQVSVILKHHTYYC